MTHIVSDRLVCGNCVQIIDVRLNNQRVRWCAKYNRLVVNSDPCCVGFNWNGVTDSDNQLMCFPREVQKAPFLNA